MAGGIAQDDARENRLIDLFNLSRPADRARHGTDAVLKVKGITYEFELKSATIAKGGISTVRDLGPDHIKKWKGKHWIMAFFSSGSLQYCQYGSPDDMEPWITDKWTYIKADFEMAKHVPSHITLATMFEIMGEKQLYTKTDARKLHKNQLSAVEYEEKMDAPSGYSPERMLEIFKDRARYVIERGATLNNPHIPAGFFKAWPIIKEDHASQLRAHVAAWASSKHAK